jgi:hypothetical protein
MPRAQVTLWSVQRCDELIYTMMSLVVACDSDLQGIMNVIGFSMAIPCPSHISLCPSCFPMIGHFMSGHVLLMPGTMRR